MPIEPSERSTQILFEDRELIWSASSVHVGWRPAATVLSHPSISWLQTASDQLEITGIAEDSSIWWSEISRSADLPALRQRTMTAHNSEGFRCVAIWKSGTLVGVTGGNNVYWLRARDGNLRSWTESTYLPMPAKAVACFPSHATGEIIVILADGDAVRVPVPV